MFLIACIIIFVCAKGGSTRGKHKGWGEFAKPGSRILQHPSKNSVSSQCAHGKQSTARKPEDHTKSFKW